MNILITSAGQRVSLVRSFQTELKKYFENGQVFTTDLNPILAPACHVSDQSFTVPRVTSPEYIDQLLQLCLNNQIKLVVPTIDTELLVLSENIEYFKQQGIHLLVSEPGLVRECRDKRLINQFFENHGICIPQQYDLDNLRFPVFVKPYDGSLSKGIFTAYCAEDIKIEHYADPKLMFMEYIAPEDYDEFTVDCYYDKASELKCVVPRKRIFVRAGEVNKGVTKKNVIVTEFNQKLKHISGARGCLTIQVFLHKTEDKILGIEINPRFGGGYPLSYLAGANYSQWVIREYLLNQKIEEFSAWSDNLLMLRYDAEVLVNDYQG
ncbi:ATP-grasp domain-containing protein [Acinetobacter radioresistens]|uniref:ATP-grasp domain-containing protein n=1 Tax=Acinetobacter radioresistens TaxID=40216 RepID=UPI0021CE0A25|nr:ATP-grasp domain-containing protein [Acinetobacter radioresistens]MCU4384204.1 ATP-grasp domain-containing protein [Acinetobacter radioresistens]